MDRYMGNAPSTSPSAAAPPRPPTPARVLQFDAHLVLMDAATKQLRTSPRTGLLSVNTTERVVRFAYKRGASGSFLRTLREPHKCVVAGLGIQIWSRVAKITVRCRFVSDREKQCCLEVLQIMGVRVVDVSPQRFIIPQRLVPLDHRVGDEANHYAADFDSLSRAFAHPVQSRELASHLSTYSTSDQLAGDIAAISRTFFGGSVFNKPRG